jgi:hypothetical protein
VILKRVGEQDNFCPDFSSQWLLLLLLLLYYSLRDLYNKYINKYFGGPYLQTFQKIHTPVKSGILGHTCKEGLRRNIQSLHPKSLLLAPLLLALSFTWTVDAMKDFELDTNQSDNLWKTIGLLCIGVILC